MAYDRDSFLSGLAVGRTLWRPHKIAPGALPIAVQCFAQGEFPPCDWTWSYPGQYRRNLVSLDIQAGGSGWGWGSPSYWFLHKLVTTYQWVVCSPDVTYQGGYTSVITMGLDVNGNEFSTAQSIRQDQAVDGVGYGRHWVRYDLSEYSDFSDYLVRYPLYLPYVNIQAFLNSARLTEIAGQKYLIGVNL